MKITRKLISLITGVAIFAYTPTLLGATILLTAEDFALLGGTAITSTGAVGTIISNGDVGLSPGATTGITGFAAAGNGPAVIVNGAIVETGGITQQARLDLIKVQTALNLMPSDTNLSNQDLGGMTLNSGVYTFNEAATLNGALVLDAQGQDNAYWVFQIGTSLTQALNSTITVINPGVNGVADYGLFWNAGSTVITGANSQLLGNYLSGTSVTFGAQSSGDGRALALAAITLDQNALNGTGWTGGLMYDEVGNIVVVPETSAGILLGIASMGIVFTRARRTRFMA